MKDNEQNFDELKRLLKLKQHEVPPPGYYNKFSGNVISRLRAGELGRTGSVYERLHSQSPWVTQILAFFESKHAVVGGLAIALCLLVLGVVVTEKSDKAPGGIIADLGNAPVPGTSIASITAPAMLADAGGGLQISTNAASLQPMATLFGQQNPLLQSASFGH